MSKLIQLLNDKNISTWNGLIEFVKNIPYGRNANRTDFSLVLTENKGTCSSKHAFLKEVSSNFTNDEVKLIIGIFKMNGSNIPKIKEILIDNAIDYIPEAHCYLKINGIPNDFTVEDSLYPRIKNDILNEIEIESYQVADFKVNYHRDFLKKWITETNQSKNFEEFWMIREKCIEKLSE
jgi:hypothetical protein